MKKVKFKLISNVSAALAIVGCLSFVVGPVNAAASHYNIVVDGKEYGRYESKSAATQAVVEARQMANEKSGDFVLSDFSYDLKTSDKKASVDNDQVVERLCDLMLDKQMVDVREGYVLKTDGYSLMLGSQEDVFAVLDQVVDRYDVSGEYSISLQNVNQEGHNALQAVIMPVKPEVTGEVKGMSFVKDVIAMKAYGAEEEIKSVDEAVASIVTDGALEIGVTRQEQYSQEFDAEEVVLEEDDWYEGERKVLEEGTSGMKDVTAEVFYVNGQEAARQIVSENVTAESVARVVKVGTKERPSFIKPLNGGSFSSGFGGRWGRRHEGVDWSCGVGTRVFASCKGTVTYAGWQNGYGNTIVINHGDGFKSRYAHLNSISVSSGQKVEQGQQIGCSGNTGRSTGPHLHFEILLDGEPVNPMNYL